jgi:hypothetical protein
MAQIRHFWAAALPVNRVVGGEAQRVTLLKISTKNGFGADYTTRAVEPPLPRPEAVREVLHSPSS